MARLLLYTAVPIVAKGFGAVLSSAPEFDLVHVCADAGQLPQAVALAQPDLVILDMDQELPFERLFELRHSLASHTRIVLWVNSVVPEVAYQSMRMGVRGILRKTLSADVMLRCLQQVARGECWFEDALSSSFQNMKTVRLSRRESQLISLVSQGHRNKEIADRLSIAEQTVKIYLSRVFRKVGVKDRLELALYGLRNLMTGQVSACAGTTGGLAQAVTPVLAMAEETELRPGMPHTIELLVRSA